MSDIAIQAGTSAGPRSADAILPPLLRDDRLKPGGLAVHIFPSSANLPLLVNRLMPEWLTHALVRFAQPERDIYGKQVKFKAYYKLCGAPSASVRRAFDRFGFDIVRHKGFVGHDYYLRFPVIRDIELAMRKPLAALGIPIVSGIVLIAQRR